MKFTIQVPTVTLSVTIAAVDGCSVSDAAAAASAIVRPAFRTCPNASAASSGGYTLPPYPRHSAAAATAGISATSHAASSTSAFAAILHSGRIGCCASSLSAPLCLSPPTTRIATKGRRNAAASSHALNVGAQTPMSGENASPTPADVPLRPLSSAYVRTALMNETPTSGPMSASITHQARDASSSRHSLTSSQTKGGLRARKHGLLEIAAQIGDGALALHAPAAQQDEAIAHARGVRNLMD